MENNENGKFIKQPTLQDIANECNVSVSTVSRALNKSEKVKGSTAKQIREVASRMNYTPNDIARRMVSSTKTKMIGFLIPNIMNPYFAEMTNTIERILSEHGYILTLVITSDDSEKLSRSILSLIESRAAGMIVGSIRDDSCKADFELARKYMEIVSIQGDVSNVDRIDVTDEQGTYDIVSHLILNGHKRIGFIGYQYETRILKSRLDGYKRALAEHSIEMNEQYIGDGEHSYQSGYNMTMDLLSLPTPPTAIHCFNEYMAYAAFDAIRDRGLRVPEDVSLTGFDNLFISRVLEPRLTTIDTHVDMMAKLAMDMLLDRIEERISGEPQHLYISHKLIKRGSVASI